MTDENKTELNNALDKRKKFINKMDSMDEYFLEKLGLTNEQLELLGTWYPEITAGEIMYSMEFQKTMGLSILKKEVWLIRRGGYVKINDKDVWIEKYQPMVGIEGARQAARYKAKEMSILFKPARTRYETVEVPFVKENEKGEFEFIMKKDLVGIAEMDLGDEIVEEKVVFSEVAQTTKEKKDYKTGKITEPARLTKFWSQMPLHMIQKVAEFRLYKKVFGLSIDFEGEKYINDPNDLENVSTDKIPLQTALEIKKLETVEEIDQYFDDSFKKYKLNKGDFVKAISDRKEELIKLGEKEEIKQTEKVEEIEEAETSEVGLDEAIVELDSVLETNDVDPPFDVDPPKPELTNSDKFIITMEEAGISDDDLIRYINEVKGIPETDAFVIKEGDDFIFFRDETINNQANLVKLINWKKGFKL